MIAATLLSVALSLSLAQHGEHAAPAPEHGTFHAAPAENAAPHVATPAEGHGEAEAHGVAGAQGAATIEHGAAAGHDESLGAVMMHHVADGYVIEFPGFCANEEAHDAAERAPRARWDCELNLNHVFGTTRDEAGHAAAGPLVFHAGATTIDMTPTKHVVMMWIASALLLLVVFGSLRKKALVPRGLYNFIEMLVQFVRNEIAIKNIGEKDADRVRALPRHRLLLHPVHEPARPRAVRRHRHRQHLGDGDAGALHLLRHAVRGHQVAWAWAATSRTSPAACRSRSRRSGSS